jgi:hypothetical protein
MEEAHVTFEKLTLELGWDVSKAIEECESSNIPKKKKVAQRKPLVEVQNCEVVPPKKTSYTKPILPSLMPTPSSVLSEAVRFSCNVDQDEYDNGNIFF